MAGTRVGQHYVQVLGNPDQSSSEMRVTRLWAEVLVSDLSTGIPQQDVSQTINFVSTATGLKEAYPVAQSISFSSVANITRDIAVTQNIDFADIGGIAWDAEATDTLGIYDLVAEFNYVDDRKPVEQVIAFAQVAFVSQALLVTQDLGITQSVNVSYPFKGIVSHFMGLQQHVTTPHRRWVEQDMGITHRVTVPIPLIVSQTITFTQDSPIGRVDQTIAFTQTASGAKGYVVKQVIDLDHSNFVQSDFVRLVEQDAGIVQSLTYYEDTPCARKRYSPFQGEGTGVADNLAVSSGSLLDRFSLYTPVLGVRSSEVILRAPEMDDRDRNAYNRVAGETRGGRIRVFADPIWPKVRTLAVTIIGLTEAQVDELQTFLDATLGQEVGITDWKGNLWRGTVMNPNDVATQDGRASWTVSLEIEAEPVDTVIPENSDGDGQTVTFGQSVSVEVV